MNIRKSFSLAILLGAACLIAAGIIKPGIFKKILELQTTSTLPLNLKNEDYDKLWKRVDSATNKGLSKTALAVLDQIYNKAKAEDNAPQYVKAVIHRMKFWNLREEFSLEKSIVELQKETETATFPSKPVLQSILADAYWQYYNSNRWKFYNRTNTSNFKKDDIETWTLTDIVNATINTYVNSLQDEEKLKATRVDVFEIILNEGDKEGRAYRPTLYDFLSHRAIEFFMNSQAEINKPANQFHLNDDVWLKPIQQFIAAPLPKVEDSLNLRYHAVRLYQNLAKFHERDTDPSALADLDLQRLRVVYSVSRNENKDSLYLQSLRELANRIHPNKLAAEAYYHIAAYYNEKSVLYDPYTDSEAAASGTENYKLMKKKAREICVWVQNKYPSTSGAYSCQSLVHTIEQNHIRLSIESVNEPNKPFRSLVTYRNLTKMYVRVLQLDYKSGNEDELRNYYGEEVIKRLAKIKPVQTFTAELPSDGDYQTHKAEIKMPALPNGNYMIFASSREDFDLKKSIFEYARFWNSNIAWISRNLRNGSEEFYVVDRLSGKALPNVTVQPWFNYYDYKSRRYVNRKGTKVITDQNGYALVAKESKDEERYFSAEFINGEDRIFSPGGFSLYNYDSPDYTREKAFIFLDRGIYRPGQTVYFKGIHLEGDRKENKLVAGRSYTYTLYDVNYQKVSSLELTTNEYGTVSGSFTAPQGLLNGQMHINCTGGSIYLRVEDYKRPKFETAFNPVKGAYALNDSVTVNGSARAYAGYAIDGAQVKYRVVRNVRYPYWYYWWNRYASQGGETEMINGETVTNDTGGFVVKFKALPDPTVAKKNSPYYTYTVYADVTDINGETRSSSTGVTIGYKMLELNLNVPENIEKSATDSVSVSVNNLNGVPEPAQVSFTIHRLQQPEKIFRERLWERPDKFTMTKEEYYAAFPFDIYDDEDNKIKWKKEAKVSGGNLNTSTIKKFSLKDLSNQWPGVYVIEATCKDKNGEEVKDIRIITLYDKTSDKAPEQVADWYNPVKLQGEPGEKASFIQASAFTDVNYLFSIEKQEKVTSTKWQPATMKAVEMDITEKDRGNFGFCVAFFRNNRCYQHSATVSVPHSDKELELEFSTFRDKLLPGQQEEWRMTVKNKNKEKQTAELLASMYDASLDAFAANNWNFNILNYYYNQFPLTPGCATNVVSTEYYYEGHYYSHSSPYRYYDRLNYFGLYFYSYRGSYYGYADNISSKNMEMEEVQYAAPMAAGVVADENLKDDEDKNTGKKGEEKEKKRLSKEVDGKLATGESQQYDSTKSLNDGDTRGQGGGEEVKVRTNFNETAFFYPNVETNDKGEFVIKFTAPEALTKWKFMGFAHTKDLKHGFITKEVVTQKELMVQPNAPRFFREGDRMFFTAKISNLSDKKLDGIAEISFTDPLTGKNLSELLLKAPSQLNFSTVKGQSAPLSWEIEIPFGIQTVAVRVTAKAGSFTDGEESPLPVLTNRMLVTESMPLPIRSNQTKTFNFEKFINQNNNSTTLKNHKYTLEFTANPAWYAVQALPYLMEYPYECSEQTFARFYANSISSHIANSKPKIKAVFDSWKSSSPDAFLSNLEKNQELKSLLLEETPWVLDAKDESERKKRVGLLFDLNKMSNELVRAQNKLLKMQASNGGWPWFEGMPDDWYITQHIVCGMGHLDKLGIKKIREDNKMWSAIQLAVAYCDDRLREEFEEIKRWDKEWEKHDHLGYMAIHFIYARSYFKDIQMQGRNKKAYDYFLSQAKKYWLQKGRYMQGMLALGLNRENDKKTANDIMRSIKENALTNEEMGMYWKENYEGFYWYEAPVESHALMIEAFDEVLNDQKSVDDLKVWLLKSKQTQNWSNTKATTEAVYALLLRGTDWLATEPNVTIDLGEIKIDPKNDKSLKAEAGTGYFKTSWSGSDIKPSMGKVTVKKSDEGVSWGAVYWQYFENLDKITPHKTPLQIVKKLFVVENTKSGPVMKPIDSGVKLKPGDKIKCRIELRVDRDMQYVHMKDMRAAGFEPTNVLSGYRYQDGLGYYESTRDAATNFFFSYLSKGTYVFEYPMVVSHAGNFSNGITTIQCMYAPEFTSHSEGIRVEIKK